MEGLIKKVLHVANVQAIMDINTGAMTGV